MSPNIEINNNLDKIKRENKEFATKNGIKIIHYDSIFDI